MPTCTLSTMCSKDVDVLDVSIWLEQGTQLLLCDVPRHLHRQGWCKQASRNVFEKLCCQPELPICSMDMTRIVRKPMPSNLRVEAGSLCTSSPAARPNADASGHPHWLSDKPCYLLVGRRQTPGRTDTGGAPIKPD